MRDFRASHQDEIKTQMKIWKLHNRSREDHNSYNNANYHKNKEAINAKRRAKRVALLNNDERQRSLAGN